MINSKKERSAVLGFGRVGLKEPSSITALDRATLLGHYLVLSDIPLAIFTITASVDINRRIDIEVIR